ncbi:MAG: sulfotransferase [Marinilabiliales bacterium]
MIRIFIAGTARSGTTLLQSMIASHPKIISVPEVHYFDKILYKQKLLRLFNVIKSKDATVVKKFFNDIEPALNLSAFDFNLLYSKKKWAEKLITTLDQLADLNNCIGWVEKTPLNLYYLDIIDKSIKDVKIIHILRNPEDNIASLFQAGRENKKFFKQDNLEKAIKRYIKDYKQHCKYKTKNNHYFISYELLIENPKNVLIDLCNFLEISFSDKMLDYTDSAKSVINQSEKWKSNNLNPELKKSDKKNTIFSKEELKTIREKTSFININDLISKPL